MWQLLLLLLACGAQLRVAKAQSDYHSLPNVYKEAVKLAIKKAHETARSHVNFYGVLSSPPPKVTENNIYITIHLKATKCPKENPDHRHECQFEIQRPLFNCAVCADRSDDNLREIFTDCKWEKQVNEGVVFDRNKRCSKHIMVGHSHLASPEKRCGQRARVLPGRWLTPGLRPSTEKSAKEETVANVLARLGVWLLVFQVLS
ncbi:hypothetical protein GN956_G19205 [Arapaima gigas]